MKIIKRSHSEIEKEVAHGGSGARKVYATNNHIKSQYFDAMTYGYLPAGNSFDWHEHKYIEEIMVVVKGSGAVYDDERNYSYEPGDVFIYPTNTKHKITNNSDEEHVMMFVRIRV